jgi:hypothetical protein
MILNAMDEIEKIKQEVSKRPMHEPMGSSDLPHEIVDIEKMIEDTPKIAPLFVKVERYKEILENIQRMRIALKNIQFLMSFKDQLKKLEAENDELIYKAMQGISQSINDFNANFSISRGVNYIPKLPVEEKVDQSVSDLGEKISKLREELDKIRV